MKLAIATCEDKLSYPWKLGELVLIQEIENMKGHCVVTLYQRKPTITLYCYHTDNFHICSGEHFFYDRTYGYELTDFCELKEGLLILPEDMTRDLTAVLFNEQQVVLKYAEKRLHNDE